MPLSRINMPSSTEQILAELKQTFPAKRHEPFGALVNSTQGDEPAELARDFRDKTDWTALDGDWLDVRSTALSFLSNEAICFYIPAFLAADLDAQLGNADPAFILTHGFAHGVGEERVHPRAPRTWGDNARERWAGLTTAQARAIVHYLEWRIERGSPGSEGIFEALQKYWYGRAAAT